MRIPSIAFIALLAMVSCSTFSTRPDPVVLAQVAPAGPLRVGVATAPSPSPAFAVLDTEGKPKGVPVTLGDKLARAAGVPLAVKVARNSGELTDELVSGALDIAFLPVDEARRQRVDFGPDYFIFESTFLVRTGIGIRDLEEVDRPGARVIAIANTATARAASAFLKRTAVIPVPTVQEAIDVMRAGSADAFAFSRDGLAPIQRQLPGSLIIEGAFLRSSVAVALPKGRPAALAWVSDQIESAKRSGAIRQAFDDAGLHELEVSR